MKSGKFPSDPARLILIRFYHPRAHLFLINRGNSYVPSADTMSRPTATVVGVVLSPQKITSKGAPAVVELMGETLPPPYSFQTKELGVEPIMVKGFGG